MESLQDTFHMGNVLTLELAIYKYIIQFRHYKLLGEVLKFLLTILMKSAGEFVRSKGTKRNLKCTYPIRDDVIEISSSERTLDESN